MLHFYRLNSPPAIWGDYGDMLAHGMTAHLPRRDGLLQLERTGPYMPPITFPGIGHIVLTSTAKVQLEASGLTGFKFKPIVKARIVACDWHTWDRSQDEPQEYPSSGEPEDYILERPHDEVIAESLGTVWEMDIAPTAHVRLGEATRLISAPWNGTDLFRAQEVAHNFVSERARKWLEATFPEHLAFQKISLA
jgi:hypothetical protein